MTTKEKEKKILDLFDLRLNDEIRLIDTQIKDDIYKICEDEKSYYLQDIKNKNRKNSMVYLILFEYEIISYHQKTYGEYTCKEIHCANCPLNVINCRMDRLETQTLYECLNTTITDYGSKIYKACCDELDKIVEDENKILN